MQPVFEHSVGGEVHGIEGDLRPDTGVHPEQQQTVSHFGHVKGLMHLDCRCN